METRVPISNRRWIVYALFITIFLLSSTIVEAQKAKEISISVYPGFTLVNFEKALDYSDDDMEDWSEFHFSAALRGFFISGKSFQFGAEAAWQKLYYAYYVVPYGPSPVYREFNVTSVSLMALCRYYANNFFAVGGAGIHSLKSGIVPAICLEAGYMIKAGETLKFPVSLRLNPIFGSGTPMPISVGAGMSFTIGKNH